MSSPRDMLLPSVAVAAMLLAAILLRDTAERSADAPERTIARYLQRELDARVGAVLAWERQHRVAIEALADTPAVRDTLRVAPAARSADGDLRLAHTCRELEGCILARPDGAVLAATDHDEVPAGLIAAAARGRTVHSQLVPSRDSARYDVFFATPIVTGGEVHAVLAGRFRAHEELGAILGAHPPGRTGETYVVDRRGYMVTRSRFRDHSVPPRIERVLRAPRQPEQRMALAVQRSGSDVDGYLDYRGIRVVGAWRWLEDLGAGVITEMDVSEAHHTMALR